MSRAIAGEYAGVYRQSAQKSLLAKAHTTPIAREDAVALMTLLTANLNDNRRVRVQFNRGSRGRWNPTAMQITLPSEPLARPGAGAGYLRVGIVLHELAHALAPARGHGPQFVAVLDKLLVEAEGLY